MESTGKKSKVMKNKIKVIFINPPSRGGRIAISPPINILYLSAILLKNDIDVEILDAFLNQLSDEDILKRVSRKDYDVLALTGMSANYKFIQWISNRVKTIRGDTPIIAGGHVSTCMPEYFLEHTKVDACCIGEGEVMITELVRKIYFGESLKNIPNLAYKNNGEIIKNKLGRRTKNLDILPLPAYHLIDLQRYLKNRSRVIIPNLLRFAKRKGIDLNSISQALAVITQRGCPYACSFCSKNYGEKTYRHSVDNVINHFKFLYEKYGINNFKFLDEVFNISHKWIFEFCERVKKDKLPFYFHSSANRANLITEETVEALEEANFYQLNIGIESFNQGVLDEMNKRLKVGQIIKSIQILNKYNLMGDDNIIMYGWTRDNKQTMKENLKWVKRLKLSDIGFYFPCPFPNTELFDKAIRMGKIRDIEKYLHLLSFKNLGDLVVNISKFMDRELMKIVIIARHKVILYGAIRNRNIFVIVRHILGIIYQIIKYFLMRGRNGENKCEDKKRKLTR